ncbi:MAG: GntR family transcriptional regulator [Acidobacteria bacterium]|nr:GntR family transcriptional regulator [Acidobacteriota bacterium]
MAKPPLPRYRTLHQELRALVDSGEFGPGARFLTERQVSERFGISRITANKALSNLASEGLLEFRKGIGTFVREASIDLNLRTLVSFTAEARAAGKRPSTRVLHFGALTAGDPPDEACRCLALAPGDAVYYLERLRLAGGKPVILERRHICAALCPGLRRKELSGSIYELWTERYGLELAGAQQNIRAVNLRGSSARLLGVAEGAAGFLITSTGLSTAGPLWFERTLYRGDAYEFSNRPSGRFL